MAELGDKDSRTKLFYLKFYGTYNFYFYFLIDCEKENSAKALMASAREI